LKNPYLHKQTSDSLTWIRLIYYNSYIFIMNLSNSKKERKMKRKTCLFLALVVLPVSLWAGASKDVPASQTEFSARDNAQSILIYGDSITWGYVPLAEAPNPQRYPFTLRWTGVLQQELGPAYTVIEEGLNSRTAGVDEFAKLDTAIEGDLNLNGRPTFLPVLRSHEPLALVVIFLGANDARPYQNQSLDAIGNSIVHLIRIAKLGPRLTQPKILLVAPPPLGPGENAGLNRVFDGSYELSTKFGEAFREIAQREGVEFFDAGAAASVKDSIDGIHFNEEGNLKFGKALAVKIREILP
jgi:lysophospholipase L1-like esterase